MWFLLLLALSLFASWTAVGHVKIQSSPIAMLQSLDPTSYATSWGVLGALVFVIVLMGVIIYQIFSKGEANRKERDQVLMGFVDGHRKETHITLQQIADTIAAAHREGAVNVARAIDNSATNVAKALENMDAGQRRMVRVLDEVFRSTKFVERIREIKKPGVDLTDNDVEKLMRAWIHEQNLDSTRGG